MSILYKFPINNLRRDINVIGLHLQQMILLKSTNIDVIDAFTKNLTENKIIKWQMFYTKLNHKEKFDDEINENYNKIDTIISTKKLTKEKYKCQSNSNDLLKIMNKSNKKLVKDIDCVQYQLKQNKINDKNQINIKGLNRLQLDQYVKDKLNESHYDVNMNEEFFNTIIKEFIKNKLLPSYDILIYLLKELGLKGYTTCIDNIEIFYNVNNANTDHIYTNLLDEFNSFRSISLWKNGKIDNALNILLNNYEKKFHNKKNNKNEINYEYLHWAFKNIINDTLAKKSEAVLINLINIANIIYEKYNDIYIISWIWKQCFNSNWYSNQKIAMKLFLNNEELRNLVYKRSSSLCFTFLQENSIDTVYRLIELYLKFNQKESCKHCLNQLFLYQYWHKDYRSCSEIIKTSKELNIQLNENQTKKIFNIIMDRTKGKYDTVNIRKTARFKYKF